MSAEFVVRVDLKTGVLRTLWTDELDLPALGACVVTRASVVEFDGARQAWFYATPDGAVVESGFRTRAAALDAERAWANATL